MQIEGVYFFEAFGPVAQWYFISLMLNIEILLQLKSNQGDITAVFIHEKPEENEKLFVNMPKVFEQYDKRGEQTVLRLKKKLYRLCQSPRDF